MVRFSSVVPKMMIAKSFLTQLRMSRAMGREPANIEEARAAMGL